MNCGRCCSEKSNAAAPVGGSRWYAIRSSRVAWVPAWAYGAVVVTFNRLGVLKA